MNDSMTGLDLRMPVAVYGSDRNPDMNVATLKGGHLFYLPTDEEIAVFLPAVPGSTPWTAVACNIKMVEVESLDDMDLKYPGAIRSTSLVALSAPGVTIVPSPLYPDARDITAWVYVGSPELTGAMVRGELNMVESGDWLNR